MKEEFLQRIQAQLSTERYDFFIQNLNKNIQYSYRYHPRKLTEVIGEKVPWADHGYFQKTKPAYAQDPLFHAGSYYVQEASSMILEVFYKQNVLQIQHPKILDLCASPGGKTTHLLSLMDGEGLLVSNEVIKNRIPALKENIIKWGYANAVLCSEDPESIGALKEYFDVIVVDAPCSGEGMFRKDLEAQSHWSSDNAALCSARQTRILEEAWKSLKPGGYLLYSTCTFNPSENEDQVAAWILNKNAVSIPLQNIDPAWHLEHIEKQGAHGYRFLIGESIGEGFFISLLKKEGHLAENYLSETRTSPTDVDTWVNTDKNEIVVRKENYFLQSKFLKQEETALRNRIKVLLSGTWLATQKGKEYIPEHAAALSVFLNQEYFKSISLTIDEARIFLKKETLQVQGDEKGWYLMMYENRALGWAKWIGTRWNNYYPTEWRLRK